MTLPGASRGHYRGSPREAARLQAWNLADLVLAVARAYPRASWRSIGLRLGLPDVPFLGDVVAGVARTRCATSPEAGAYPYRPGRAPLPDPPL